MALVNNQTALHSVYNYYMMNYAPTTNNSSKYDTHKKSELRSVYNSIIRQTKESPLCIIDTSRDIQRFAVGMKENARQFSHTISSLASEDENDMLSRKVASSSDESTVAAKYIGESDEDDGAEFDIEVEQLAEPQVNKGRYLDDTSMVFLQAGTYSFDVNINDTDYEFQFNVGASDTNRELLDKISSLVNRSNIGIKASVESNGEGSSALVFESVATGLAEDADSLFTVSDNNTSKERGVVDYLNLSRIDSQAQNAIFKLNGNRHAAYSNSFTVDKKFELNLLRLSEDEPVRIGLKPDVESMADNINQLVDSYNSFVEKAAVYRGTKLRTDALVADIGRTRREYTAGLQSMGLHFNADGYINIDRDTLTDSLDSEENSEYLGVIKDFTSALMRKSKQISLNPMNYVQKTVVAYKNPGRSFANPYVTSMYSGMMFNSYC